MRGSIISIYFLLVANYAFAITSSDFTVEGTVIASPCTITIDKNGLVELPKKPKKLLAAAGDTAGKTLFRITLEKCPVNSSIYFQKDQGTISPAGRLLNTAVAGVEARAENVDLEILNSKSEPMNLAADSGLQNIGPADAAPGTDINIYSFYVQYYATGAATVGKVKSSVTFIVESF